MQFWASRNGGVPMFFCKQMETCLLEIFWSIQRGFWLCWKSLLFSVSSELRFIKWVRIFEQNCIIVIFFGNFCWLWDCLLKKLKLKKTPDNVHWNVWTNVRKLYARKDIFKKIILNMRFWIIYILVQISFFGALL